ncbi:MAG: CHAT domain-containing protein [Rhodocyclaceae bacterium]|jgi:CHAT domain-containing protein|nr:CHAT domain-containing protein [Rhodocyclaceae bacterium]
MSAFALRRLLAAVVLFCLAAASQAELRIQTYNTLKSKQDWQAALKVMREELADPVLQTDTYLAQVRIVTLSAMGDVASYHGWDEAFDQEAMRLHAEGLKYAGGDELLQAQVNRLMALYYSKSKRNGLAVRLLKQDLEYWKKVNNIYQIIAGYDGLASANADMGEILLRDHYRARSQAIARDYFKLGVQPADGSNEWLQYKEMLVKAMDEAARPGNREELERLWAIVRPISDRYLTPKSLSYKRAAEHFAIAREPERAAELMERARQIWASERGEFSSELQRRAEGDFLGAEGTLLAYAGRWAEAAKTLQALLVQRKQDGIALQDPSIYRLLGWSHEGAGDYDKAIEAYAESIALTERTRQSFSVAERASFFRSIARRPYWGLIRSLIKRGRPEDALEALRAMELVRARQLGEVVDPGAPEFAARNIESLRRSLQADEAVLAYILTENEVALVGLTRERGFARVIPYDERAFGLQAVALARRLAQPDSIEASLQEGLGRLSRTLLAPVAADIAGKSRLVILPDGAMNAVPFELLSRSEGGYRPLILEATVRNAPSLRFIEFAARQRQARAGSGLFAVADPAYPRNIQVAGLSADELKAVTRSNVAGNFAPLPETRSEVASIAKLLGSEQAVTLLGDKASESEVKRADLSRFRFVHLATHGILGGDVPGIGEPALVLAEEKGEDGFLTASEAEKLKLQSDLTVLSACNTGSGEIYAGEGVMGMGRAFLVAGSRSVLVSLWPVESKATEALMVSFYRNLQSGQGAAEALRKAKLEMLMPPAPAPAPAPVTVAKSKSGAKKPPVEAKPAAPQPDRSHPFFWAPFVLFGG